MGTKARVPCDRQLVYQSIAHWYGEGSYDTGLTRFDALLKHTWMSSLAQSCCGAGVPYSFLLLLCLPTLCELVNTVRLYWSSVYVSKSMKTVKMFSDVVLLFAGPISFMLILLVTVVVSRC